MRWDQPFVVERLNDDARPVEQVQEKTFTHAVFRAKRMVKSYGKDRVYIRRVKGFAHGKPLVWQMQGDEWKAIRSYNQYEAGGRTPKLREGDPCLFTA